MSKIVINGVDGNFGSLVAQYALELMNKEDLVFTAPKEESLKEYEKQGIKKSYWAVLLQSTGKAGNL